MMIVLAFMCFGLGHAVTKGLGGTRVFAGIAAASCAFETTAITAKWNLGHDAGMVLGAITIGSLIFTGLGLLLVLPGLRKQPIDELQL
jgi:hypothetical protein